ncbi:MAG: TonB-dependent receptor [Burkholderiales bacterium]|nr:TonB-dependent receptor [Burkholderiales bacterium]
MVSDSVPFRSAGRRVRAAARSQFLPSLFACPVFACGAAMAQVQPQSDVPTLAPVAVTASRTPMRVDETIAEVTVIDRAQIEQATGRTLPELLSRQPGVQFSSNGGLGKTSSIYLRGLEARHTLLLVDGVRYNSATTGTPNLDNIPLDQIERIEIVRGPMSGLYGSEAVGGVVQIFTRRGAEGVHPDASVTAGSHHSAQLGGGLRFGQGIFDGAVRVDRTVTRGYSVTNPRVQFGNFNPDDDGFWQTAASANLGVKLGAAWRADVNLLQSDGMTQFDDGLGVDSRAKLHTEVQTVRFGGPVTGSWHSALRLSHSKDVYDTLSTASAFDTGAIATEQQQITWENHVATPLGAAVLLLENLEQKVRRPGTPFTVADRTINAIALGLDGQHGPHTWQASVRNDRNSQYGSQTNGTVGYGFDITQAWRLGASYGTSFVAPSFNQLYYPNFGNPNLQPEEGKQSEVSLRWAGAGQQLRAAWFDNRIRGYISSGPLPTNIPRTRIDGFSLSYEAQWSGWTMAASLDHLDPRNVTPGASYDKVLPRRAKDALRLAADTELGAWRMGGSLNAFSHRFDDAANALRLGGYTTLDLRADWRLTRQWLLGLRLNNVGDKRYETVYGYDQPGREAFVTLSWRGL